MASETSIPESLEVNEKFTLAMLYVFLPSPIEDSLSLKDHIQGEY